MGLSWKSWVGVALETIDVTSPYGATQGTGVTNGSGPTFYLPLSGAESVKYNNNTIKSEYSDGVSMAPMTGDRGASIVTGSIPTVLIPGMFGVEDGAKLYDWCMTRKNNTEGLMQTLSATVWIKTGNVDINTAIVKKVVGAKINQMTIECGEGSGYASLGLDLIGRSMESNINMAEPTCATVRTSIYGAAAPVPAFRTIDATSGWGTVNTLATTTDTNNISWAITINNRLAEDGHRLDGTGLLRRLYSKGREVTGNLTRDLRNATQFGYFLAGAEQALGLQFSRSGKTVNITLPRMKYDEGDQTAEGSRDSYNKESFAFAAYAPYGGVISCLNEVVFTET
jgi:hypothetical protein